MALEKKKWRGWRFDAMPRAHKLLVIAGIPERYWADAPDPDFHPIEFDGARKKGRITAKEQADWLQRLRDPEELIKGHLVVFGSMFEDSQSLHVAFSLVKGRVGDDGTPTAVIDLADVPSRGHKEWWANVGAASVVVLHNITADATPDRVQIARDVVTRFPETTRMLVVAGANPVKYTLEVLRCTPDIAFYTDGRTKKVSH